MIELAITNQLNFFNAHKGILAITEEGEIEAHQSAIEKYHFYISSLRSLIEQEKILGGDCARLKHFTHDLKQSFIALVKSIKDKETGVSGRVYSWHELQNEL